jgi:hypothetical protein
MNYTNHFLAVHTKSTYIYDNPTEEHNKYLILKFNFSEVSPDINKVETSFNETIKIAGLEFIKKYETYLATDEKMYNTIEAQESASEILKYLISFTKNIRKDIFINRRNKNV